MGPPCLIFPSFLFLYSIIWNDSEFMTQKDGKLCVCKLVEYCIEEVDNCETMMMVIIFGGLLHKIYPCLLCQKDKQKI